MTAIYTGVMSGSVRDGGFPVRWRWRHRLCTMAYCAGLLILTAGCISSSPGPDDPPPPNPAWTPSPTLSATPPPSPAPSEPPTPTVTSPEWSTDELLVSAEWVTRDGDLSLALDPTELVRTGDTVILAAAWDAVVAEFPDADTPGMRMQFDCHRLGAPAKEHWFLEPWRPDVTYPEMLAARCNPE